MVFAGGEALPYRPAAEFEELTGAKILQFYGSNETGLLSATTMNDSLQHRLRTGGRSSRKWRYDSSTAIKTSPRRARPARVPGTGDQPRLPWRYRPRQAVHPGRLDAHGRHLRDR